MIQRATGRPFREVLVDELTTPTGADFHIGLDPQHFERVSELFGPSPLSGRFDPSTDTQGPTAGPRSQQFRLVDLARTPKFRTAVIPSVNGYGNARSVAALYAQAANPGGLMSSDAVRAMGERQFGRGDWGKVQGGRAAAWACGFMPNWTTKYGPNASAFGHDGFGGSFGACDPASRVSLAFVANRLSDESGWDDRGASVVRSFYECLSKQAN